MMDFHKRNPQFFELLDKAMKSIIVITCLVGVIAVAWLCTSGRQKAEQAAQAETEILSESYVETDAVTPPLQTETVQPETEALVLAELPETEAEIMQETEAETAETEEETEDITITARAVPFIPYGYDSSSGSEASDASSAESYSSESTETDPEVFSFGSRESNDTHLRRRYYDREQTPYDRSDLYEGSSSYEESGEYYGRPQENARIYFWWF